MFLPKQKESEKDKDLSSQSSDFDDSGNQGQNNVGGSRSESSSSCGSSSSSFSSIEKISRKESTSQSSSEEDEMVPKITSSSPFSFLFDGETIEGMSSDNNDHNTNALHRASFVARQQAYRAVLHRKQLDLAHRRRRLLSQRSLGERIAQHDNFFLRRTALKHESDDVSLFITFSNAAMFYDLLRILSSSPSGRERRGWKSATEQQLKKVEGSTDTPVLSFIDEKDGSTKVQRAETPVTSLPTDEVLTKVNPYFCYEFGEGAPVHSPSTAKTSQEKVTCTSFPPLVEKEWNHESPLIREVLHRKEMASHPFLCQATSPSLCSVRGGRSGTLRGRFAGDPASDDNEGNRNQHERGKPKNFSSSKSVMSASFDAWEMHLSEELKKEGETMESYRQKMTRKTGEMEKQNFLAQAVWNEYAIEIELQEKQRKALERKKRLRDAL